MKEITLKVLKPQPRGHFKREGGQRGYGKGGWGRRRRRRVINSSKASWLQPPAQRLHLSPGPGHFFCRVILSCPEGSWPKATFLVGSECSRERKHPFSPTPSQHCSPETAGFPVASAGRKHLLPSLLRFCRRRPSMSPDLFWRRVVRQGSEKRDLTY